MEQPKSTEAQRESFDVAYIFNRCSSTEMQSTASPRESSNGLAEIRNRLRHKSWVIGGIRRSSLPVEKKRSASSKPSFADRKSSHPTRYNGHQFERHKTGRFVDYTKMNVPKKWLREYEKKQVSCWQNFCSLKVSKLAVSKVSNNNKGEWTLNLVYGFFFSFSTSWITFSPKKL